MSRKLLVVWPPFSCSVSQVHKYLGHCCNAYAFVTMHLIKCRISMYADDAVLYILAKKRLPGALGRIFF